MRNPLDKIFRWYLSRDALPYWCVLFMDCTIVWICGLFGFIWEFGLTTVASNFWHIFVMLVLYSFVYGIAFRIRHSYSGMIRYSSFQDLMRITTAMIVGTVVSFTLTYILDSNDVLCPTWKTLFMIFVVGTLLMIAARILAKTIIDGYYSNLRADHGANPVFIYGTLAGAIGLAKGIRNEVNPNFIVRGFVNASDEVNPNLTMMGMKIYSPSDDLVDTMKEMHIKGLIVSPVQVDNFLQRQSLIDRLTDAGIRIYMMHEAQLWDGTSDINQSQIHEVEVEDLLPRDKIDIDLDAIGRLLSGKCIMITGAAGSIGSEMVRQVAKFKPAELVLIDQAETPMHDIRRMMASNYAGIANETIVTSITNKSHMEMLFAKYRPDYVFHAAAYKHVPMMEDNPALAVQNNIYGTRIIADLAVKYGTKKFVMVSTDKAVNPTNVMGCSKRICEIYCQSLNKAILEGTSNLLTVDGKKPVTQFVTTRFGNVLGSNGSVIPIFREQIKKGGPVTVTHPDIIRFFMLIPEACRLVLEAGTMGKGGEIFVFDMGAPVRIVDLAKRMIRLSGSKDIEIKFSGLRDGEKLYEEVLSDKEQTKPTSHPKIMIASVREYDYGTACRNEERLLKESYTYDDMAIVKIMKEIVPEYKSQSSKYQVLDK